MNDTPRERAVDFGAFVSGEHHIELASGRYLDLAAPDPRVITAEDIAHGLSFTCRFAGQVRRFYSVAEHAVLVAERLVELRQPPAVVFLGLHHDDAEAFIGDVTRPLKALLPGYRALEEALTTAIGEALGLPGTSAEGWAAIKAADDWALSLEAHYLLPSKGETWFCAGFYGSMRDNPRAVGVPALDARQRWLRWHRHMEQEVAHHAA